jgi:hypothetical protein
MTDADVKNMESMYRQEHEKELEKLKEAQSEKK